MKKILFSILIIASLFLMSGAFAADDPQLSDYKYLIVNTSATNKQATAIPTGVLDPTKHRVLRFKVTPIAAHSECYAALYDATSAGNATDKVAEGEVESDGIQSAKEKYERPLNLKNGVTMIQGPQTAVLVEWEYKY